ncbi:unnamed protein product [Durusdinium trenchii]|uniref:Uncharacterized protein n=2 Tax=Durusdinium trenchii TaxID=1381693 RepID=A0ABP0K8A9_9DINO
MESAWQPSEELWLLARTKLVAKDFMPPSDVRAVESTRKLQEDWERRKPVMVQACPWQRHLATENRSQSTQRHLEADLRSKIIHPSIQPLVKQILNSLSSKAPDDVDIWHMSALRAAASTAHGAGSFLLGSFTPLFSNPGEKTGEAIPAEPHRLVLKASRDEDQLLAEMEKLQKVQSSLGPLRSPRVLSAKHTEDGLFAFAQEFLLCSRYFEAGQRERQSSSFADLLRIGARPLALEDAGRDMEDLHARLGMSAEDLAAVSLEELRHAAQQTGELLGSLASLDEEFPSSSSACHSPYVSWSTSLINPKEVQAPGRCHAVQLLLELEPMLERYLLGKEARASPLHGSVRRITEDCCLQQFGTPLADILQSARALRQRLKQLISAESRNSEEKLPPIEVPSCWSHPRLTCRRLVLRDSTSLTGFELCASGWSGLCFGPIYSDLARVLTDALFEAVKLPSFIEDFHMIYSTEGHAGVAVPPVLLGEQLGITTGAATFILGRATEDSHWSEEALGELFGEATENDRPYALADLAQLMSWLRFGRHEFNASTAMKVSEALIAWELPLHARPTEKLRKVPKPTRTVPRQPDIAGFHGHRAVQYGWQAVREIREAAVNALPAVKGDVDELWPLMWLVPSLQRSLQLVSSAHISWMQKVWVLQHIHLLCGQLSIWLDGPSLRGGRKLEVTRARRHETQQREADRGPPW